MRGAPAEAGPGAREPAVPAGQTAPLATVVIFILIGDYAPSRHFSAVVGARLGSPAGMVRQQCEPVPAPCAGPRVGRAPAACRGLSASGHRKAPRLLGGTVGLHMPCLGCLLPVSPLPPVPGRFPRVWAPAADGRGLGPEFPRAPFLSVLEEKLTITDRWFPGTAAAGFIYSLLVFFFFSWWCLFPLRSVRCVLPKCPVPFPHWK